VAVGADRYNHDLTEVEEIQAIGEQVLRTCLLSFAA